MLFLFQHFVTDRKVDEEIGRTTRFHYDSDHLKNVSHINFWDIFKVRTSTYIYIYKFLFIVKNIIYMFKVFKELNKIKVSCRTKLL